jgi:hypothetical protein
MDPWNGMREGHFVPQFSSFQHFNYFPSGWTPPMSRLLLFHVIILCLCPSPKNCVLRLLHFLLYVPNISPGHMAKTSQFWGKNRADDGGG